MKKRTAWILGIVGALAIAIAVILLWPPPDPLANVDTVAIRIGDSAGNSGRVDVEERLRLALGDRDIEIVADEAAADVVLELTNLSVNLGDIEFSVSDDGFQGHASAVCTLRDVETGRTHVMDFHIRFEGGQVAARLVARKFWEFWKRSP